MLGCDDTQSAVNMKKDCRMIFPFSLWLVSANKREEHGGRMTDVSGAFRFCCFFLASSLIPINVTTHYCTETDKDNFHNPTDIHRTK